MKHKSPMQENPLTRNPSKHEQFTPVWVSSHTCSHPPRSWLQRFTLLSVASGTKANEFFRYPADFPSSTLNWSNAIFLSILCTSCTMLYTVTRFQIYETRAKIFFFFFFLISVGWSCKNFFFFPPPLLWKEFLCKILKDEIQLHMEIWKLICSTKNFLSQ